MESKLYYECHITIEPVFGDLRQVVSDLAKRQNFKLADLLMKKREEDTEERSSKDTFITGHSKNYQDLKERMLALIMALKVNRFKVWRYKIEDTIIDSRSDDVFKLLSSTRVYSMDSL